ncbi:MAG: hypothetical protein HWE27_00230 [Gammaproteobacteria bacterium]|nr:hypothetical protein [Gammaproteobacteria bacterium]
MKNKVLLIVIVFSSSIFSAVDFKKRVDAFSQVWLSEKTPGSVSLCGGSRTTSSFKHLSTDLSYFSTESPMDGFFFYAGQYRLQFECKITQFKYDELVFEKTEVFNVDVNLLGGKVYDAYLEIKDYKNWTGCTVNLIEKN